MLRVQDVEALGGAIARCRVPTPQANSVCGLSDSGQPLSPLGSVDKESGGNAIMDSLVSEKSVESVSFYTSVDAAATGTASKR